MKYNMLFKDSIIYINEVLKWEPYMIFHIGEWNSHFKWRTEDTKLGIFMGRLPFFIEAIIKTIYYVITWPLYLVVKLIWLLFIGICFPQKWFE